MCVLTSFSVFKLFSQSSKHCYAKCCLSKIVALLDVFSYITWCIQTLLAFEYMFFSVFKIRHATNYKVIKCSFYIFKIEATQLRFELQRKMDYYTTCLTFEAEFQQNTYFIGFLIL